MPTPEQTRKYAHYLNGAAGLTSLATVFSAFAHTPYVAMGFGAASVASWIGTAALARKADKMQERGNSARVSPQDVDLERDAPERARGRSHELQPSRTVQAERTYGDAGVQVRTTVDVAVQTDPVRAPSTSEQGTDFARVHRAVSAYNAETMTEELRRPALSYPSREEDVTPWNEQPHTGTLLPLGENGEHAVHLGRGRYQVVAANDLERFTQQRQQQNHRERSPQAR
jgi:hypothetical protein